MARIRFAVAPPVNEASQCLGYDFGGHSPAASSASTAESLGQLPPRWAPNAKLDGPAAVREAAGKGSLECLAWLEDHGAAPARGGGAAVRAAARGGHLEVLRWLEARGLPPTEGGSWAARAAAEHGHVRVLQWLWDSGLSAQVGAEGGIVRGAAQGGQMEVLEWVKAARLSVAEGGPWALRLAAAAGHLEALQFLVRNGMGLAAHAATMLRGAAKGGCLEIMEWLVKELGKRCVVDNGRHLILAAAEDGNLEVLRWLSGHGVRAEVAGGAAVWVAVKGGHLEALEWLAANGLHPSAGGDNAVRAAVKGGSLKILKWLVEHGLDISEGGKHCGPHTAARRGNLEVLRWIALRGAKLQEVSGQLVGGAARGGRIEVLRWLKEQGIDPRSHSAGAVWEASAGGQVEVLQWLVEQGVKPQDGGWEAVQSAAAGGHLKVLNWLSDHDLDVSEHFGAALVGAATGGHLDVLTSLVQEGADLTRHPRELVEAAAAKGHVHILEWLYEQGISPVAGGSGAVRRAATGGQLAALQWLFGHGLAGEASQRVAVWAAKEARQHDVHQWLHSLEQEERRDDLARRETKYASVKSRHSLPLMRRAADSPLVAAAAAGHDARGTRRSGSFPGGPGSDINDPRIVALSFMMKYPPGAEEGIFDSVQRDSAAGCLETLGWVRQLLGEEWTIRLTVESGQLSILQFLVADGLDLKANETVAVRLAAEHGHLEMLRWFGEQGLELGETVLEAAATGGMVMLLETLQTFELPLAHEARLAEEIAPFIHKGRLNATLLANCILTPSSVAEQVLEMCLQPVRKVDHQGKALSRAMMSSRMNASSFMLEPDCDTLRRTIAPQDETIFQTLTQSGENVPVVVSRVIVRGATCPLVLHALASTERWEIYETVAASAIIEAAWKKVRWHYQLDMVLLLVQLAAVVHLTWWTKLPGSSSEEAKALSDGGGLPLSFWPVAVKWLHELLSEVLQAKALLYDHRTWRRDYFSLTEAWDWLCLLIMGVLLVQVLVSPGRSNVIPWLSVVGFSRWWKVLYALRAFQYFGRRILPILGTFREILPFLLVIFFYGGAFIHALYALSRQGPSAVALQFFRLGIMGDPEMGTDVFGIPSHSRWSALQGFWFVAATLLVTTALMNIFIAIMSSAFHAQEATVHATFLRTRANICLDYALCWEGLGENRRRLGALLARGCCGRRCGRRLGGGGPAAQPYRFAPDCEEVWLCHRDVVEDQPSASERLASSHATRGAAPAASRRKLWRQRSEAELDEAHEAEGASRRSGGVRRPSWGATGCSSSSIASEEAGSKFSGRKFGRRPTFGPWCGDKSELPFRREIKIEKGGQRDSTQRQTFTPRRLERGSQ